MESTSSEKTGGVPPSQVIGPIAAGPECQHIGPGGRRCHMAIAPGSDLCAHHDRILAADEPRITDAVANALLAGVDDFSNPLKVTIFLGHLAQQVIRQRVGRRDAITLTYICQLILNSQGAILRDAERRQAIQAKQPREIVWDIPGPKRDPSELQGAHQPDESDDQEDDE